MDSILAVRIDAKAKEQGLAVMRRCGYTPSMAVRKLFDYCIAHDSLPFEEEKAKLSRAEIKRRIEAFDLCHTEQSFDTKDSLRAARIKERYGSDA